MQFRASDELAFRRIEGKASIARRLRLATSTRSNYKECVICSLLRRDHVLHKLVVNIIDGLHGGHFKVA